jgi:hypothetical protein
MNLLLLMVTYCTILNTDSMVDIVLQVKKHFRSGFIYLLHCDEVCSSKYWPAMEDVYRLCHRLVLVETFPYMDSVKVGSLYRYYFGLYPLFDVPYF